MQKTYQIITYGCQMNRSDSERIAAEVESIGYKPAYKIGAADLIIVNACSVRQSAIDRIWGITKKFAKLKVENCKLKIILTGCVLPTDRKKFSKIFDIVLDIKNLSRLPNLLNPTKANKAQARPVLDFRNKYFEILPKHQSPFSALVPIMTGCDNFCAFCVVPYTRGREISRPTKEIICEVKNLVKNGYKEIWLLGQNVNSYKSGKTNFPKLLKMVNNIPGNFWLRFTSPHPKDFSDELIDTMTMCEKYGHYLNLPVQSGDNEVLKKMNRPYTIAHYKNLVKKVRKKIPDICLSTDVIVGFPGETKKQFQNTAKLFREIKYDMAYISQYSPRPGTAGAQLADNVPKKEKIQREKELTKILAKTALEKNKKYISKEFEVLPEEYKNGFLVGKTKSYKTVKFKGNKNFPPEADLRPGRMCLGSKPRAGIGKFIKVKIIGATPWGLKGIINYG